jgi:S-adenosylmethionine:tRNA ribosyltransferase-isomerase
MNVADFDFHLPADLIAQEASERGRSRLLVLPRHAGAATHTAFDDLPRWLSRGDLLVLNDSRVFPARLLGHRVPSGGAVECFLVARMPQAQPDSHREEWDALVHPGAKLKPGARVLFERDGVRLHGEVRARTAHGRRIVALWTDAGPPVMEAIDRIGHMPLPPYIKRDDREADRERYQTVYADERGSIAAPTAGLHFTDALLADLQARGVEVARVTLHVGYGTFKPVRVEQVEDHQVDPERISVSAGTAGALTRAKQQGRRIIAVGTTTARVLESLPVGASGEVAAATGEADVFIRPGHRFRLVDGLITNFHLPRSSLLMLVCAFGGRERVLAAYADAVARGYRFYSYGDAMLIL